MAPNRKSFSTSSPLGSFGTRRVCNNSSLCLVMALLHVLTMLLLMLMGPKAHKHYTFQIEDVNMLRRMSDVLTTSSLSGDYNGVGKDSWQRHGRSLISACGAGKYKRGIFGRCYPCAAGLYQNSNSHKNTKCKACPKGQFSESAASACKHCPIGKYQPDTSKSSCRSCLSSTSIVLNSIGASKWDQACYCVLGSQFDSSNSVCTWCEPGNYSSAGQCKSCPAGRFNPVCGKEECGECLPGTYSISGSHECTNCESGKYANEANATKCEACLPGHSCIGGIMKMCPRGTKEENFLCKPCDAGRYSINVKSKACIECPKGTYNDNIGSSSEGCTSCPMGKFSGLKAAKQATDCLSCDTISQRMTTIGYGAQTSTECSCEHGTYFDPLRPLNDRCETCPKGAECKAGAKESLYGLTTTPGFWRESIYSRHFFKCLDIKMCKGGNIVPEELAAKLEAFIVSVKMPGNINVTMLKMIMKEENASMMLLTADAQCAEGYTGTLCTKCAKEYKFSNSIHECIYCPGENADGIWILVISCSTLILFIIILAFLFSLDSEKADSNISEITGDNLGGTLGSSEDVARDSEGGRRVRGLTAQMLSISKISAGFFQVCSSMTFVFDLNWPVEIIAFFDTFKILNFDVFGMIRALNPCSLSMSFYQNFWFRMSIVPICSVCIVIAFFFRYVFLQCRVCLGKKCGKKFEAEAAVAIDLKRKYAKSKKEYEKSKQNCDTEEKKLKREVIDLKEKLRAAREYIKTTKPKDRTDQMKQRAKESGLAFKNAKEHLNATQKKNAEIIQRARIKFLEARKNIRGTKGVKQALKVERQTAIARMM